MIKENLIKLTEALNSAEFKIEKIDYLYEGMQKNGRYGDTKIFLSNSVLSKMPMSQIKDILSKEIMINLIEILYSAGYGVVKYEFICERFCGIKLVLQTL
jgi:phosphoserine aminotransferase